MYHFGDLIWFGPPVAFAVHVHSLSAGSIYRERNGLVRELTPRMQLARRCAFSESLSLTRGPETEHIMKPFENETTENARFIESKLVEPWSNLWEALAG